MHSTYLSDPKLLEQMQGSTICLVSSQRTGVNNLTPPRQTEDPVFALTINQYARILPL